MAVAGAGDPCIADAGARHAEDVIVANATARQVEIRVIVILLVHVTPQEVQIRL
jgi:hypothetical protein